MEKGPQQSSGGGINREWARKELAAKPWLREKILELAANEEGPGRGATQIMETMMNRAEVRGTTLEQQARWTHEGGYYDDRQGRARATNTVRGNRQSYENSLDEALRGSNHADYATDNSSGQMARDEANSGKFRLRTKTDAGNYLFSPGWAERGYIPKWEKWQKEKAAAPTSAENAENKGNRVSRPVDQVDPYAPGVIRPGLRGGPSGEAEVSPRVRAGITPEGGFGSGYIPPTPVTPAAPQGRAPQVTGPGKWQDLPKSPTATNWSPGTVDSRLREIMWGAKQQFEKANPGYTVYGRSGQRTGNDPHGRSHALDVRIFGPDGKEIDPYSADKTGKYTELARHALGEAQARYPDLVKSGTFGWGGFSVHTEKD